MQKSNLISEMECIAVFTEKNVENISATKIVTRRSFNRSYKIGSYSLNSTSHKKFSSVRC